MPQKSRVLEIAFAGDHDTGLYSTNLLYDYGTRQDEMWRHELKRMHEKGAGRDPAGKR